MPKLPSVYKRAGSPVYWGSVMVNGKRKQCALCENKAANPKGSVLSLQAVEAYGAKDRPLWKNSFTDKEEEKLSKAKEKLQQIEQAGNDWYAVYGTEIQEDLADYPSWIRAN